MPRHSDRKWDNRGYMPLGIYISVPFCRTKCSYCNFASEVFSKGAFESYVRRVIEDIANTRAMAAELGGLLEDSADSVYLGGGTPSILESSQLIRIFDAVRAESALTADAEITVECAPGTLSPGLIETLARCGVNRVSLGVQSFVDQEAQAVGRLHKRAVVLDEIAQLRSAGIANINIDLIAGLPHQTAASWEFSLAETIAAGVPHASVYMLEIDEDSRLGRELIAGGTRYHAHFVPDEEATADFYLQACETLNAAGIAQYEISNFAGPGAESRHNLKYWTRQPYFGFGVDAHSMLPRPTGAKALNESDASGTAEAVPFHLESDSSGTAEGLLLHLSGNPNFPAAREAVPFPTYSGGAVEAVRFSTPDSLDAYMNRAPLTVIPVSARAALEERFFLGLRLNRGVDLERVRAETGLAPSPAARMGHEDGGGFLAEYEAVIAECRQDGLLERQGTSIRLTPRGRLLSNEVFAKFLHDETVETGGVNPR